MTIKYLSRAVALTLMLTAPMLTTMAHADDEYGTGHETVIRNAAIGGILGAIVQNAPEMRFVPGQHDNFGAPGNEALIRQSATSGSKKAPVNVAQAKDVMGYYAANGHFRLTAPLAGGLGDLVGSGGHQDELAREIYRPGGGTDFGR